MLLAAGVGLTALCFAQSWGRIVVDSKLDLVVAPTSYMRNSLNMWDPLHSFGQVQEGTFGFLIPMGPFFALGHALHIPVWCIERAWIATLLAVGLWGVVRLAEALGIGSRVSRVLAGIAFALAPTTLALGSTTVYLLASMLLPWVLLPLVRGSRGGSPRAAAARSGVAVALMGGVNAATIVAVLPLPLIWLLTRGAGRRRRSLLVWWIVAAALATFWWVPGLILQGKYGYNYLPFSETAAATTATTSVFETLRGTSYWLNFYNLGGPAVPGGWTLASSVGPIIATSVVTALGLFGLARRDVPERLFLVGAVCLGTLVMAAGYAGLLGGPLSSLVRQALDGPLVPFRNVSKLEPVVTLPLVLGLAHAVKWLPSRPLGRLASWQSVRTTLARPAAVVVAAVALGGAATPFFLSQLYSSQGFTRIPAYWTAAADWMSSGHGNQTSLLIPGAAFGEYTWGRPLDEPLGPLASSPWAVRELIPPGSNGSTDIMDAVEQSLDSGVASPGLAPYLSRAGVGYLVVRNDLDWRRTGSPPPDQVRYVLTNSPGLVKVASFGPAVSLSQASASSLPVLGTQALSTPPHAVEIYRVNGSSSLVQTNPVSSSQLVSGAPGSLLPLADAQLADGHAAVLSGDGEGAARAADSPTATWVATDGNQRRNTGFGDVRNNQTYVFGPDQQVPETGQPPKGFTVVGGTTHQTVAAPIGVLNVSSSSSQTLELTADPAAGPAAAFDGDPSTAWVADAKNNSQGQWVGVDFGRAVPMSTISVAPLANSPASPTVSQILVSTEQGSVRRLLPSGAGPYDIALPHGASRWLRITLERVEPPRTPTVFPLGAGIRDVTIPGVTFRQTLGTPDDAPTSFGQGSTNPLVYLFNAPLANGNLTLGSSAGDDDPHMSRFYTVPHDANLTVTGTVTPRPGPALEQYLGTTSPLQVSASSSLGNLPRFQPENMIDLAGSPWIASPGDSSPYVDLRWQGPRLVDSIALQPDPHAAAPLTVLVTTPYGSRLARVPTGGGLVSFAPLLTDSLRIQFVSVARGTASLPVSGLTTLQPVGLDALYVPALGAMPVQPPNPAAPFNLPCGQGPPLSSDNTPIPTSVSGTIGDLIDLKPLALTACTPAAGLSMAPGRHLLQAQDEFSAFKVTSIVAQTPDASALASDQQRSVQVLRWGPQYRTVEMGGGANSYLEVAENFNQGWSAELNGRTLQPVRLDGWKQGWIVPSGVGGQINLTYTPDRLYRWGLVLGAVFLGILCLLALGVVRQRRDPPPTPPRPLPSSVVLAVAGIGVLALVSGPLALVMIPLLAVGWRWRSALPVVGALAFVGAGVAIAFRPAVYLSGVGPGIPGLASQALAVTALAALLSAVAIEGHRWTRRPRSPSAGGDPDSGPAVASRIGLRQPRHP